MYREGGEKVPSGEVEEGNDVRHGHTSFQGS